MIITKTPYRISFFGGGTDLSAWLDNDNDGLILSSSINRYCYITLRNLPKIFDYKYRLRYYIESGVMTDARFEIKIKKNDINYKKIIKLDKKIMDINLMNPLGHLLENNIGESDLIYNICHVKKLYPVLEISYLRSYYNFFNSIVTVDKNITYQIQNKKYYLEKVIDDSHVLELKILISDLKEQKKLQNEIPFRLTRFSKYTKGLAANKKLVYI